MRRLAIALFLLAGTMLAPSTIARSSEIGNVRAVFARHDPDGRLPNTRIKFAGSIRIGRDHFRVYDLNFTNPISRHGMQRVAIILNGRRFLGSYQTDGQTISVRGRRIFSSPDSFCRAETSFSLKGPRLSRQVVFACDLRHLEDTI